jgi:hypothetical protein
MMTIDNTRIESVEYDYCVVLDNTDGIEVTLPCIDDEDAYAMQHMFGGEVITRKVFIGEWHALLSESNAADASGPDRGTSNS